MQPAGTQSLRQRNTDIPPFSPLISSRLDETTDLIQENLRMGHFRLGSPISLPPTSEPRPDYNLVFNRELSIYKISDLDGRVIKNIKVDTEEAPIAFRVIGPYLISYSKENSMFFLYNLKDGTKIKEISVALIPDEFRPTVEDIRVSGPWLVIPFDGKIRVAVVNLETGHSKQITLIGKYLQHSEDLTLYSVHDTRFFTCFVSHIYSDPRPQRLCPECVLV